MVLMTLSHNFLGVASKNIFYAQMSPTIPPPSTVPLTINTTPPESYRDEIERASIDDFSDISRCK